MTKEEIIEYLYENNVRGDLTIEQMAEDIADASQKEYKRGRLDALNELKAYIREMGAYDTADTPQTETKGVRYCNECKWFRNKQVCGRCRSRNLFAEADTPQTEEYDFRDEQEYNDRWQTDCPWMYDSRRDYEYDKALDELERNFVEFEEYDDGEDKSKEVTE